VGREFDLALRHRQAAPTNVALAWQFGRACFDRAELATNHAERAELAEQGIAACRRALHLETNSAAAHYYLAMNLGQLARTRTIGALKLVDEMEAAFKTAGTLDERFDFAGPDRNLGLLYLEAPGWPTSIGSRSKARHHLRRAVELSPQYPENRLNLVEACLKWGDRSGARRGLKALEEIWSVAQANFSGETWSVAWRDWEQRLQRCRRRLAQPSSPLVAPHQRG
jgi:tetratricopeptide (TPR) repeat protein